MDSNDPLETILFPSIAHESLTSTFLATVGAQLALKEPPTQAPVVPGHTPCLTDVYRAAAQALQIRHLNTALLRQFHHAYDASSYVTVLDLSHIYLGPKNCLALLPVFRHYVALHTVNLEGCGVCPRAGLGLLTILLQTVPMVLRHLNIAHNPLGTRVGEYLVYTFWPKMETLNELHAHECLFLAPIESALHDMQAQRTAQCSLPRTSNAAWRSAPATPEPLLDPRPMDAPAMDSTTTPMNLNTPTPPEETMCGVIAWKTLLCDTIASYYYSMRADVFTRFRDAEPHGHAQRCTMRYLFDFLCSRRQDKACASADCYSPPPLVMEDLYRLLADMHVLEEDAPTREESLVRYYELIHRTRKHASLHPTGESTGTGEVAQMVPLPRFYHAILDACWDEATLLSDTLRMCSRGGTRTAAGTVMFTDFVTMVSTLPQLRGVGCGKHDVKTVFRYLLQYHHEDWLATPWNEEEGLDMWVELFYEKIFASLV